MFLTTVAFYLVKGIILLYTYLTFPLYALLQCPSRAKEKSMAVKARVVQRSDKDMTMRGIPYSSKTKSEIEASPDKIDTMSKLFNYAAKKYHKRDALGTREVIREEEEQQSNGKTFTKMILGDYHWLRYCDVSAYAEHFGKGIRMMGVQPREHICIFADTRAEWLISALGCFKNSIALCTIYTNLGNDGIVHGIRQTQVNTVITSSELLPKLVQVLEEVEHVKNIIYFESSWKPKPKPVKGVTLYSYKQVVDLGKQSTLSSAAPRPEDPAIIMYTSGSTGVPKGVILSHRNMVSSVLSLLSLADKAFGEVEPSDTYIAFLPLAHVLEIAAEHVMLMLGVRLGYSSPNTLTDKSTMIKPGEKGDASILRPTAMAAVPLILDRIYKGIQNNIAEKGAFSQMLVNYCIDYRRNWVSRGYDTPIMNWIIFSKMRASVGGRLRLLLSGGAPLSSDAHIYIRTVLTCPVLQGYGLTETCSTACISDPDDLSVGHVGPPLPGVDLKIVDWDEGGYTVQDSQGPRGEIVVGGHHVSSGYYNMPEKTKEDFFDGGNGKMFFKTGDIGQLLPSGSIKIIDRKKDLVKLQHGEYVSLGKVESNLKIHPLIENICVYGDSAHNAVVALVVPDTVKLSSLASNLSKAAALTAHEELCQDATVVKAVEQEIQKHAKTVKLEKFEIPQRIHLISEPWTPESGLVTAAFKLRRKPLQQKYQDDLDTLYLSLESGSTVVKMAKRNNNNNKISPE